MFKGRIGRADYWKAILLVILIIIPLYAVYFGFLFLDRGSYLILAAASFVFPACLFTIAIFELGLSVRRFHDLNLSGWWFLVFILLSIIPYGYWSVMNISALNITGPLARPVMPLWLDGWQLLLVVVGLLIAFWPGTPGVNKYGAPEKYRSWWAALVGKHEASFTQSMPSSFPDTYAPPTPPVAPPSAMPPPMPPTSPQ